MKPRALDLFCGAGGATRGLQLAGFHVTGVDIKPQPRYCGDVFIQGDALTVPLDYICDECEGSGQTSIFPGCTWESHTCPKCKGTGRKLYDFIWASPPCQAYTMATSSQRMGGKEYPDLVEPVRARLKGVGVPYVIENVLGAPLQNAIMLCGSMFGLRTWRHRLFETTFDHFPLLPPCNHIGIGVPVCGHNTPSWVRKKNGGKNFLIDEVRAAIGIDWMNRDEMAQAIPPAYSEFIGRRILEAEGSLT